MCPILSEQYLLNRSTILTQTWYCGVLSWGKLSGRKRNKQLVPYRQCQGHNEGLYNQNMTISTMSSKLLVRLQPNSVLLVQHYKPECPAGKKKWITALKVKVTSKVKNVSEYLSGWYLLNHKTFCYQTWYGDAADWARVSRKTKIVCCLQGQGHSEGSYYQNIALTTISSELLNWTERIATKIIWFDGT